MLAAMGRITRRSLSSCQATYLRPLASSLQMCRTTWPPSPRCRLRAGVRTLPTGPFNTSPDQSPGAADSKGDF
eukprot:15860266-Heterocapsa_arctica.AAC.1